MVWTSEHNHSCLGYSFDSLCLPGSNVLIYWKEHLRIELLPCFCRQRQDDKWAHDLYDNDEPQISSMVEDHINLENVFLLLFY